ncbi:MAG: glycosyltransferase family 39 protein [Bacteroidetes bacterium]|nr:glycosyltransferase family 39 protein [Bacteroidota bacterium]
MQKFNRFLYFLAFVKFILPFLLQSPVYEPHRDEFLYLIEGRHMAWGFMEVPPLLSVFAWLTNLFGGSMFWIKFWPSLFGALNFILVGKIILSLGGRYFALLLGFLPFVTGAYLRVHYLFQPNFLEIFFWTLIAYSYIRYIQTQKNKWLYILGVAIGFGMLSKYSVLFFTVSVLGGLLVTDQRKIFTNKHFYYAAAIGFLIFLPNLIWQIAYHFPVALHMKKLQRTQLQYISPSSFLAGQVMMNFACAFVWVTGLIWTAFASKAKPYRFIAWAYVFVIILLLLGHGKDYYALGAYPVLFAFGAYQLEQLTAKRVYFLRYVFIVFIAFIGYYSIPILLPIFKPTKLAEFYSERHLEKTGALRWEDLKNHPLPQDFADMIGWKTMAEETAKLYNSLPEEEKSKTVVKSDNYGLCGALNFYGPKLGLPQVFGYDASFLLWIPDTFHVRNVITVGEEMPDPKRDLLKYFESISIKYELRDSLAREDGSKILLWYHCNADTLSRFLKGEIAEKKKIFYGN